MGKIHANDPDYAGSAYFDVLNLRSTDEYKVSPEINIRSMSVFLEGLLLYLPELLKLEAAILIQLRNPICFVLFFNVFCKLFLIVLLFLILVQFYRKVINTAPNSPAIAA